MSNYTHLFFLAHFPQVHNHKEKSQQTLEVHINDSSGFGARTYLNTVPTREQVSKTIRLRITSWSPFPSSDDPFPGT